MGTSDFGQDEERFQPVAMVLAFVLPGAGHMYLGHVERGACIFAGVAGLFAGGLLIGGIGSVESQLIVTNAVRSIYANVTSQPVKLDRAIDGEPMWFLGAMFVGPAAFTVDYLHQYHFKVRQSDGQGGWLLRSPRPDEGRAADGQPIPGGKPTYVKALGRVGEIGTLYCTVAGMLNLIAIIDASHARRRRKGAAS